jgi:hypothetical protein
MALQKLKAAFRECNGPFSWRKFGQLLSELGYEQMKAGKTAGSRRKYHHPGTGHLIFLHEPHGDEMGGGMVKRLQQELEARGLLNDDG